MKIRNGFVSNSSSSSFLIFGKRFEGVSKFIKNDVVLEKLGDDFDEDLYAEGLYEVMEQIIGWKEGLEFHINDYDDDDVWVGVSWKDVGDNETGLEFKQRVADEINKKLGTSYEIKDLSTYEEAWNG